MTLCGAVWFWPQVISWRIWESLGTKLDEHCRLMTCVCLPPTSSVELHVLKTANDTNRMRKTTVLPVYWWEILYAWDERGRKLYKCSSCCPFSWPSQWLCTRRGGKRRVISLLPTRNHHKRQTSSKRNWDILLMYAKYLVECHTVDRGNFADKIFSRPRPTAKIKHVKNKITRWWSVSKVARKSTLPNVTVRSTTTLNA